MKKNITGVLIDTQNNTVGTVTLDGTLEGYYTALHCSCIDIVSRSIGKIQKYFEIVCDDEGLFSEAPQVSAVDRTLKPMLVGSLFIAKMDEEDGELKSLTEAEQDLVLEYVRAAWLPGRDDPIPVRCQVGY